MRDLYDELQLFKCLDYFEVNVIFFFPLNYWKFFFTQKNIHSFKWTALQGCIRVCYSDHGRPTGELVTGIQREGDYVTAPIHKPSIGPHYLPDQALIL